QTTVIGGLNKEISSDSESGIPGLKDIPLLGYLFKGDSDSNKMEDILIFITPHILKKRTLPKKSQATQKAN
ncbi:MAG: type IV pilus secretin PilQ, partial [Deltaproteobacteria bacterium]|nr:type IV pilus secretin PilQ [Deltaproteobacteria bacterium]